jgi:hypothetical protein
VLGPSCVFGYPATIPVGRIGPIRWRNHINAMALPPGYLEVFKNTTQLYVCGLLVPDSIIAQYSVFRPLIWLIRYIYVLNVHFLNNVIIPPPFL